MCQQAWEYAKVLNFEGTILIDVQRLEAEQGRISIISNQRRFNDHSTV